MPGVSVVPVCCGVDWLTVTQRPSDEMEALREVAYGLAEVEMSRGEPGKPWSVLGYEGFICGQVSYGERYDGCIAQLTGVLSSAHWQRVYELCASVTRIDYQVTLRRERDPKDTIMQHYKEILAKRKTMRKAPKVRILAENVEALTVYSGAPSSDCLGRIYDKWRESKAEQFRNCVRYELKLMKKRAKVAAFRLAGTRDAQRHIALNSLGFFARRGCSLRTVINALGETAFLNDLRYQIPPSTTERQIEWLRKSVRPTVLRIREHLGVEETRKLLGLD